MAAEIRGSLVPGAMVSWRGWSSVLTLYCPPITIWTKYARLGAVQG